MNKMVKVVLVFVCIILIFSTTNTYASTLGDVLSGGKDFIGSGNSSISELDDTKLKDVSNVVYNILLMISFIVVAVVGIILGIKYMMANVEDKADVKNSLLVFVIGCIVVYGAFGIWRVVVSFLNNL